MDRLYLEFPRMGDVRIEGRGVQDEREVFVVRGDVNVVRGVLRTTILLRIHIVGLLSG